MRIHVTIMIMQKLSFMCSDSFMCSKPLVAKIISLGVEYQTNCSFLVPNVDCLLVEHSGLNHQSKSPYPYCVVQ